jgi:hypothetical protein
LIVWRFAENVVYLWLIAKDHAIRRKQTMPLGLTPQKTNHYENHEEIDACAAGRDDSRADSQQQ